MEDDSCGKERMMIFAEKEGMKIVVVKKGMMIFLSYLNHICLSA
jgi:hypothetical protein